MVTDSNQTYGYHFVMYRNIKSPCCAPVTNVVLQVNYTSENKLIEKEIRFVVARGKAWGDWELDEGGQNVQTSSYQINRNQGCIIQHDEQNEHGCVFYMKVVKRVNPESSHHKENNFFLLFCMYMR